MAARRKLSNGMLWWKRLDTVIIGTLDGERCVSRVKPVLNEGLGMF